MSPDPELVWPAPAKLNLMLRIVGRRADGYHRLQTVFQLLDYGDELRFAVRDDGEVRRLGEVPGVAPEADLEAQRERLKEDNLRRILYQEVANLAEDAGSSRLAADLYRRAAQAIREADASSYGEILLKLAESQSNAQNYHAALQTLRQATSNNPADPRPYLLQAEIFQTVEQPESVVNCLETAIGNMQQPADQIKVHTHLALALRQQGKYPAAYYHAVQAAELTTLPDALVATLALEIYVLAAELAQALLLTETAQGWLAKAAAAEPPSPGASAWLVRMHCLNAELGLESGETIHLTEHLETGLRAAPLHPRLLAAHARWLLRQGEFEAAQAGFHPLGRQNPEVLLVDLVLLHHLELQLRLGFGQAVAHFQLERQRIEGVAGAGTAHAEQQGVVAVVHDADLALVPVEIDRPAVIDAGDPGVAPIAVRPEAAVEQPADHVLVVPRGQDAGQAMRAAAVAADDPAVAVPLQRDLDLAGELAVAVDGVAGGIGPQRIVFPGRRRGQQCGRQRRQPGGE